jgi:hypothetical protein
MIISFGLFAGSALPAAAGLRAGLDLDIDCRQSELR